ncbi:GNAT family N-acetyltransferase [Nocardioides guangzhouensis]|uniref:GNAT family N-acetyltransferase n=1 Tax=Nocardioides guangzhouensis TaxID=2497878 RepID=A0A4Q4ZKU2_9ACTN|nr:GNAT family N-acetyltransferase [Nocardioides guangzhouensis]RYP88980.1 GNAT family N-acetyltransferase [Nocardioides guangzhouensis]
MELVLTTDAGAFLRVAGEHLAADPLVGTVVATVAEKRARDESSGEPSPVDRPFWFGTVEDRGAVVGVAMRTAPFAPYPLFALPMPDEAALLLARTLHERGEALGGVNGALPAVRLIADETVRLAGGAVVVDQHTRLFELRELAPPVPPPGHLRLVEEHEAPLALDWFLAFHDDADEQAGRAPGESARFLHFDLDDMLRRIRERRVYFWDDGGPVHLTGHNLPAYGVARIGPVYTPREHRGRGYASAGVAEVSLRLRDAGARVCLFTDQANPTSNKIYEAIGYRRVVDMANLLVRP